MKISDWLLGHYKKKFGEDLEVLEHGTGSTWNDGGAWNDTTVRVGGEILRIYMPSDYNTDNLEVKKMRSILVTRYVPVEE